MRAIVQDKYGPPSEVLRLAEIPRPAIAEDEVLVHVLAASVHADIWHSVTGRPYSWRQSEQIPLISTRWSVATKPCFCAAADTHSSRPHSWTSTTRWQRSQSR